MKLTPVASPHAIQPTTTNVAAQNEAKARVVSMLTGQNAQVQESALDQNRIAPEDMGSIRARSPQGQPDSRQQQSSEVIEESAPLVEEPQQPKEDPAVSRKFAELARREKQMRMKVQQQEQQFRQREQELKAKEALLSSKDQEYQTGYIDKKRLTSDPLSVLAEAGLSYDDLVQQVLNQPQRDPRTEATFNELKNEIKALRQANEDAKRQAEQQQSEAYQAAVRQIKTDVTKLVSNDPTFETIKSTKSINDVVDLIERTYKEDRILMSIEDAANEVENYLIDEAMKLTKIGKIKQRLQSNSSAAQVPVAQKSQSPQQQSQPMKTLTNANSTSRSLTARERALLAFKGQLKS